MALIVVDAGHGGYDTGASFEGRLEKEDNLRLARAVRDRLQAQGQNVLMTRDTDVFIPLSERASIANTANADLFISLHRNSFVEQTPTTNGVENWIQTNAKAATEEAARIVLDHVVAVGVQSNRGVKRGNYAVLRETNMPAMLLEVGFIINEEDNRLFDTKLNQYADAIASGLIASLLVINADNVIPETIGKTEKMRAVQQMLNDKYGAGLLVDGLYGPKTKSAIIRALQIQINHDLGANLVIDGIWGPKTMAAIPNLMLNDKGNLVYLLQMLLFANGFDPGIIDGIYGPKTKGAVEAFQRSKGLTVDGIAGPSTYAHLISA